MRLEFVSEPSGDATSRVDLTDRYRGLLVTDLDLGAPELQGDPGAISPEYGYRRIAISVEIARQTESEVVGFFRELARELTRAETWLLVQLDTWLAPAWFRVYRSPVEAMNYRLMKQNVWAVSLTLVADPFALGAQVSREITISDNPTSITNPVAAVLSDIEGDAPTPLTVELDVDPLRSPLLSVIPLDVEWPGPQFWQAESWTTGADTTTGARAGYSGGSSAAVSFATTTNMANRLTGNVTPSLAGTYRLFARVEVLSGVGAVVAIEGGGDAMVEAVTTEVTGERGTQYVELGSYVFPRGNPPVEPGYTLAVVPGDTDIRLRAEKVAGAPTLHVDFIVAVPTSLFDESAPGRLLEFTSDVGAPGAGVQVVDGEHERVSTVLSGSLKPTTPPSPVGGYPMLHPGATNVLHFLPRSSDPAGATLGLSITELTLKYRPRFVYLPGA